MLSIFSCACWPSVYLCRNIYLSFLPIKKVVLKCMSCLYVLESNPLLVALFTNIFSQFIGCLFILFMISFVVQKFLNLMRSHLLIFAFVSIPLEMDPSKYCCDLCQRVFCL